MTADASQEDGLYGDLYGAEDGLPADDPFQVDFKQLRDSTAPIAVSEEAPSTSESVKTPSDEQTPVLSSTSKQSESSSSVSYSAQIARQFSSYNQSPSQERQQRLAAIPTFSSEGSISAITSFESRTPNISKDAQIKPSDMKDEG